jgi:ribosomal protein L37AE/L43A
MICQACGSETDSVSGIWVCRNCDYNGLVAKEYRAKEWRERRSTA